MRSILPQTSSRKAKMQGLQSSGGKTYASISRTRAEQNRSDAKALSPLCKVSHTSLGAGVLRKMAK